MKLKVSKRAPQGESLNAIRRQGNIPAVIYRGQDKGEMITVEGADFEKALRTMEKGHLPTTVFEVDGKRAIVKEIQYHPSTYQILHVDFQELKEDRTVDVNVPTKCLNEAYCTGIKLGGFLRQVRRHVKVRCLPKDMPKHFEIDVKELNIGQAKKAKDIAMGSGVRSLFPLDEVVVVIAKR